MKKFRILKKRLIHSLLIAGLAIPPATPAFGQTLESNIAPATVEGFRQKLNEIKDLRLSPAERIPNSTFCKLAVLQPNQELSKAPSQELKSTCAYLVEFYSWFLRLPKSKQKELTQVSKVTSKSGMDQWEFSEYLNSVAQSLYGLSVRDYNILMASMANFDYMHHRDLQPLIETLFEQTNGIHQSQRPSTPLQAEDYVFYTIGTAIGFFLVHRGGAKAIKGFRRLAQKIRAKYKPKQLEDLRNQRMTFPAQGVGSDGKVTYQVGKWNGRDNSPGAKNGSNDARGNNLGHRDQDNNSIRTKQAERDSGDVAPPSSVEPIQPLPSNRSLVLSPKGNRMKRLMHNARKTLMNRYTFLSTGVTLPFAYLEYLSNHNYSIRFQPSEILHVSQATLACTLSERLSEGYENPLSQNELKAISYDVKSLLESANSSNFNSNAAFLYQESDRSQQQRVDHVQDQARQSHPRTSGQHSYISGGGRLRHVDGNPLQALLKDISPKCETISLCTLADDLSRQAPNILSAEDLQAAQDRCGFEFGRQRLVEPQREPQPMEEPLLITQTVDPANNPMTDDLKVWTDTFAEDIEGMDFLDAMTLQEAHWEAGSFQRLKERLIAVEELQFAEDEQDLMGAYEELEAASVLLDQLRPLLRFSAHLESIEDWENMKALLSYITSDPQLDDIRMGQILEDLFNTVSAVESEVQYFNQLRRQQEMDIESSEELLDPSAAQPSENTVTPESEPEVGP